MCFISLDRPLRDFSRFTSSVDIACMSVSDACLDPSLQQNNSWKQNVSLAGGNVIFAKRCHEI